MSATSDKSHSTRIGEIKAILRSLLISEGSNCITIRQLNALYKEMEDTDIPFKEFNYSNLSDFLYSLSDTLKLEYNKDNNLCVYYIKNQKSAHISSLVSRQKKNTKKTKSFTKIYNSNYNQYPKHTQNLFPNYIDILNQVLKDIQYSSKALTANNGIRKSEILSRVKNILSDEFSNSYTINNLNKHLSTLECKLIIKNDHVYFKDPLANKKVHNIPSNKTTTVPNNKIYPSNSTIYPLKCENKKAITCDIECLKKSEVENGSFESLDNEQNSLEIASMDNIITERTKIRLTKLLQKHPEGIWCSELPNIYKSDYNIDLEYSDLGFNSITEFVAALPDIFQIVQPPNSNRQMVLNAKASISNIECNQTRTLASLYNFDDYIASDPEPVPVKLSIGVSRKLVPDGVMNLNETVDHICVTSLAHEEYIEVNISEIFTPSFFWITLRKNKKKIKTFMSELDIFYNKFDLDKYKIPPVILEPGLNIACTYSNIWHRGIVKKIKPDGSAIILFYDYGTIKTYNPNDLYFLNKKFSALPAQAIACGLYNIKPIENCEWPNKSINTFIDKVWSIPLIAFISTMNEKQNTMMITLTDTSDEMTDLHINDWMVENKLAEWGKMVCMRNNFTFQHYQKCLQKKDLNLTSVKSKNKKLKSENIVPSELTSICTQNCGSYASKKATIEKYNSLHYNSNNYSTINKLVHESNIENKNEGNSSNVNLFNRYKKLSSINQKNNSIHTVQTDLNHKKQSSDKILQQNYKKDNDDLDNLFMVKKLESIHYNKNKSKCCQNLPNYQSSEIMEFQNITENGHKMKPIQCSLENSNNALLLSSYNSLLYHLKRLKN